MGNVQIVSTLENKSSQKTSIFHSSSTVFFGLVNLDNEIDTEISLLNHFILKRGISDVIATVEIRNTNGFLDYSFKIEFNKKSAYKIRLSDYVKNKFIGSVFIYFNSNENLAIPFCAVTSVIKTKGSVCGVHTYGRRLEQKELGTWIDMSSTIETGWTLRDTNKIKSFSIMHIGDFDLDLDVKIECLNHKGEILDITFKPSINALGILYICIQDLDIKIIDHLKGKKGHAKIFIRGLKGVFPRMLCGNYKVNDYNSDLMFADEIQFTHTNFDFTSIKQPEAIGKIAYYNQPSLPNGYGIIYPVQTYKKIEVNGKEYKNGEIQNFKVNSMQQLEVRCENENLPSRFVTAAIGVWDNFNLESECSTGIFIEDYIKVPCHWHWGLLKPGFEIGESKISIMLNKFYRNEDLSRILKFRVYNDVELILEKNIAITESLEINVMDYLPRKLPEGVLWYVLSGDKLEDLHVFSSFYPQNKSGFTEHAF